MTTKVNTIASMLNFSMVGEISVKGKVEYDAETGVYTFEDGSKARQFNGLSVISEMYEKYWKEVK